MMKLTPTETSALRIAFGLSKKSGRRKVFTQLVSERLPKERAKRLIKLIRQIWRELDDYRKRRVPPHKWRLTFVVPRVNQVLNKARADAHQRKF